VSIVGTDPFSDVPFPFPLRFYYCHHIDGAALMVQSSTQQTLRPSNMVPSGLKKTIAKLKLTSWLPIIGFLVVGVYWLIQTWSVGQVSDASAASSTASKVNSALLILILLTILTSNLERDVKNREFTEELENKLADFRRILSGHQEILRNYITTLMKDPPDKIVDLGGLEAVYNYIIDILKDQKEPIIIRHVLVGNVRDALRKKRAEWQEQICASLSGSLRLELREIDLNPQTNADENLCKVEAQKRGKGIYESVAVKTHTVIPPIPFTILEYPEREPGKDRRQLILRSYSYSEGVEGEGTFLVVHNEYLVEYFKEIFEDIYGKLQRRGVD